MAAVSGGPEPKPPEGGCFAENRGVFVTLSEYPSGYLRGCIGFPYPYMPLSKAIAEAAQAACHDPRFPALSAEEAKSVTVEVTVLTVPEAIEADSPDGIVAAVRIGVDGLMLDLMGYRGLFLPQVPTEQGWDVRQYLDHLSYKAGLPAGSWKDPDARISRFQGEIFSEKTPFGPAERRDP